MEAKVDVRKLQLLNDRIAQTIEALNQVRLSVIGLSHTPVSPMAFPPTNLPYPGYNMATPPIYPPIQGMFPGLQHTPFQIPFQTPFQSQFQLPNVPGFVPQFPITAGFTSPFMSGLSHSSPELFEKLFELKASDPYRLAQTFPFMNTPTWPTNW
jgi:hypothetical protein